MRVHTDRHLCTQLSFISRNAVPLCHNFCLCRDFMCLDGQNTGIMKRRADWNKEGKRERQREAERACPACMWGLTALSMCWPLQPNKTCRTLQDVFFNVYALSHLATSIPPILMVSTGTKMLTLSEATSKTEIRMRTLWHHCSFSREQTAVSSGSWWLDGEGSGLLTQRLQALFQVGPSQQPKG